MTAPDRAFLPNRAAAQRQSAGRASRRFAARPLAIALAGASLLSLPSIEPAPAHAQAALPSGLAVVHGQAAAVVDGNRMTVTNSANSILNWDSFSIGAGHGVHFAQPDAASKVLNRVLGNDPSAILGSLSSNGGVWLLNPNGVLFGHGARVDVGHLVTSTLRLNDVDWLNGRFNFAAAAGDANNGIVNRGELRSSLGGQIALLGGSVSNEKLIEAPDGQILLAAGRSIDLVDTGSPHLRLRVNAPADAALNLGTLAAPGGRIDVHGAVVNQQGVVRADSFGVNAAGEIVLQASESIEVGAGSVTSASGTRGGRLTLDAGRSGTATIRGSLLATGNGGGGGDMTLLGQRIGLTDAARLDVSGDSGGSLHIGGGPGGRDPALPNSQALFVGAGVTLDANATGAGDGGRIVLWSDQATRGYGRFSARGGPLGGNGGFIETSGGWVDVRPAGIDASAPAGRAGSWLLDPGDITITSDTSDSGIGTSGSGTVRYESNSTGATLRAQTIQATLEGGSNVVVATGDFSTSEPDPGDIFVRSATIMPALKDGVSLTLQAHRNIEISGSDIGTTGAPLSLSLNANGAGNGGKVSIDGASTVATGGGNLVVNGAGFDSVSGSHGDGISIGGASLAAGTGSVTLNGTSSAIEGFALSGIRLSGTSISAGSIALNGSHGSSSSESFAGVRLFGATLTATEQLSVVGSGPGAGVITSFGTTLRVTPPAPNPAAAMTINGTNTLAVGPTPPSANHGARISGDYGGLLQTTNRASIGITGSHQGGTAPSLLLTDGLSIDADGPVSLTANSPLQVGAQVTSASPINLFADDVTLLAGAVLTSTATGDAIVIAGRPDPNTSRFVNSAGAGALSTPAGRWLIFGRNPTLLDPGGLPFDFSQYNARFGSATPAASGNGLLYADTRTATVSGDRLQKTYDGSNVIGPLSAANPVFSGLAPGDIATLPAGTNGSLANPNVGSAKPVAVSPLALTVQDGSGKPVFGYGLESNLRGDVTPRPLTLGSVSAQNKSYDGNTAAQLNVGALSGLVAGEALNATVAGQFDTKDAGNGKTVTITTALADGSGGLASNYQAPPGTTTTADILRRQLTLNDVSAESKAYDGNRNAVVNFSGVGGLVGSETVATNVTGLFDTRDVGSGKPVDVGITLGNGSNGGLAANYLPPLVSPSPRADITPRPVQANALAIADKRYDGNRNAAVTLGPLTGLVPGETLAASSSGLFDSKDVGTARPVALDVQLGNGSGGGVAGNYRFVPPPDPRASITPAPLTIRASDASKTFGQTLVFDGSEFSSSGLQAGETVGRVTLGSAGAVNTAPVAGSPYAIVASDARGGSFDARNYDIAYQNGVLTVQRANLQAVLVDITGNPTKVYDGSDVATLAPGNFGLTGFVAGDSATVVETSGRYDSPNAGGRTVSANLTRPSYAPVGSTDLDNYQLPTLATGPGTILPRTVTLSGVQADNKVYDGDVAATLSSPGTLAGLVGGQTLQVRPGSARFDTKDAGTGKTVTVEAIGLADGSGLAANYRVAPTATTTADIAARTVTAGSVRADNKVYDGTTRADVTLGALSGLVGSETLGSSASGEFDTKDVGSGKQVTVGSAGLTDGSNGGLARNYRLAPVPPTRADITPRSIAAGSVSAADKVYDGTTQATVTIGALTGLVGSETLGASASGRFDTKDAGTGKTVTVDSATLADGSNGGRAGNYSLAPVGNARADITPRSISAGGVSAADKVYDGTTRADITLGTLSGLLGSETLGASAQGRFDTRDVGSAKLVSIDSATLADGSNGGLARNYVLAPVPATRADITPRALGVGAVTAADKVYDASTVASVSGGTLSGLVGNETLATTLSGRFDTANVGSGKTVAVTLQLGNGGNGGLAANYRLPGTPLQAQASITPATLTYAADPQRKLVGEPLPALTGSVGGFVGGETQAGATTGTLRFNTPATPTSPAGLYPINGSGLSAGNYRFVQAPANATALNVGGVDVALAEDSSRAALSSSRQAVTPPPFWSGPTEGRVFDVIQALRGSYLAQGALFRAIPVADMSQESLAGLLAARDRYKKALFSEAIRRLEQDPTLADLPACASVQEVDNGSCLITEDLKRQLRRERATTQIATPARPPSVAAAPVPAPTAPAPAAPAPAPSPDAGLAAIPPAPPRQGVGTPLPEPAPLPFFSRRVRTAALPQIERKIAIVIGVDDYTDRRIPQLDNAVKDARTVGQLLESTLGYETVVLENATRQSVVRTLNRLAIELEPSDSVVVYYAGHGELVQETGLGYWQLSDANPNRPETWMSNADISRLIGRIGASQVALISDSCYSGSLVDERIRARPGEVDPQQLLARKTVVVMSSGGNEPVFDEGKNGHSPFAFSLMRNLEQVSKWQVGGNVFERVRFAVARELPQRPLYGSAASAGHQAGGDYLFEQRQLQP